MVGRHFALGLLLLYGTAPAQNLSAQRWESVSGIKASAAEVFLSKLRRAVETGDRVTVSRMVAYPLQVTKGKKRWKVQRASDLARQYDRVFSKRVRQAIARQEFEQVFVNAKGAMIGTGEVWFSGVCERAACADPAILIVAVNTQP